MGDEERRTSFNTQPSSLPSLHPSPMLAYSLFLQDRFLTVHPSSSLLHTFRSSTALAAETIPSRHLDTMGMTLRSASAKLRYVSPSFTVRRSSMSCRFCDTEQRKWTPGTSQMAQCSLRHFNKSLGNKQILSLCLYIRNGLHETRC